MSSYKEGQIHQLADKFEEEKFTPDDITKLGQSKDLSDFRGVLRGTHEIVRIKLLEFLGNVAIPANPDKFVVENHFKVNTSKNAPVKISGLGSNLKKWFLDVVEDPSKETNLRKSKLLKSSLDTPIIAELGGHNKVATIWFSIWHLLLSGQLDKNKRYVFYVEDKIRSSEDETVAFINSKGQKAVLRAVDVDWYVDGWYLAAFSVLYPGGWVGGYLFFSRNSSDTQTQ